MKTKGKYIIIALFTILAITVVSPACKGSTVPTPAPGVKEVPPAKAIFQIADLAINPPEINPGEKVTIAAKVTNTDNTEGDYIAELRIDNPTKASLPAFRYSDKVSIAAGASQLVSVVVTMTTPATYRVTWAGLTGEFVVVKPAAKEASLAPATFQTDNLSINPAEVNPGVEIVISAKVTNTGKTEGTYTAGLKINDVTVATLEEFLAAGASQVTGFAGSVESPGTYKVTWFELIGGSETPRLIGEFVVVEPDETITSSLTAAPGFTGVDVVTGKTISLSQFRGSVVLLNFVNYGCSPSVNKIVSAQLLAIKELTKQRSDFMPLSIFCGCCPPEVLRKFAKDNGLTWPWILDTDNSIVQQYASYLRKYGYPTLVFIDKEQRIREVTGYGDVPTLSAKIDKTSQY